MPGMVVVAVILDGDDRVFQVGGNLGQRDVAALLVEPEPVPAVAVEEHRVADAAIQLVNGPAVARRPGDGHQAGNDGDRGKQGLQPGGAEKSSAREALGEARLRRRRRQTIRRADSRIISRVNAV